MSSGSRQLRRHNGGNALKSQDNGEELRALPLKAMECGIIRTLKVHDHTHEQAQIAVFEYIEVFYNRQRCHSANGYLAPLAYEQALKANERTRNEFRVKVARDGGFWVQGTLRPW
jgi:Integrase core domain